MSENKNAARKNKELPYFERHGDLPCWENVAPRDFRGRQREIEPDEKKPLAPDGISGYW